MNQEIEQENSLQLKEVVEVEAKEASAGAIEQASHEKTTEAGEQVEYGKAPFASTDVYGGEREHVEPMVSYADAVSTSEEESNVPAVLGLEQIANRSWSKFNPATDPNRKVIVIKTNPCGEALRLSRKNDKPTEGITIDETSYAKTTGLFLKRVPKGTQVTFVGIDGKTELVGYAVVPKNGSPKVYLPIKFWPGDVEPPVPGKVQRVKIKAVIFG